MPASPPFLHQKVLKMSLFCNTDIPCFLAGGSRWGSGRQGAPGSRALTHAQCVPRPGGRAPLSAGPHGPGEASQAPHPPRGRRALRTGSGAEAEAAGGGGSRMRSAAGGALVTAQPEALRDTSGWSGVCRRGRGRSGGACPCVTVDCPWPQGGACMSLMSPRALSAAPYVLFCPGSSSVFSAINMPKCLCQVLEQLKKMSMGSQLLPKHETEFVGVCHLLNEEAGTACPQPS
ncbi:uncharacterized protein [Patagioenas fasciata]|uniref:uncharacterized protein n=1 Tax=Patagioenas fasciata TaxID=372321 RepID=UPI003A9A1B49